MLVFPSKVQQCCIIRISDMKNIKVHVTNFHFAFPCIVCTKYIQQRRIKLTIHFFPPIKVKTTELLSSLQSCSVCGISISIARTRDAVSQTKENEDKMSLTSHCGFCVNACSQNVCRLKLIELVCLIDLVCFLACQLMRQKPTNQGY